MSSLPRVLFVDDDQRFLDSLQRIYHGKFDITVASSGQEGLEKVESEGPFPVVVTDLRMPEMDGIAFLKRLMKISPDTIRILLTGFADMEAAFEAVNKGHVYKILAKPCQPNVFESAIYDGIRHNQLLQIERDFYALKRMQDGLHGVVLALVRLVEARDPYTAGHQSRVTQLACAIGQELGLDDGRVEQIELSATIHDLGKVLVPAEYLSKPGILRQGELDIVRMHAQLGHDILESIDFGFPLQKIVLQHHERMDGSGYPHGLKGENIMLEARVIAVADVVEAMSSHRPYRPSLGLEGALQEITEGRGKFYDSKVVDICLALFKDKGWSFTSQEPW